MPSRGHGENHDPKRSAEEIMRQFDKNNDKTLSMGEFITGYADIRKLIFHFRCFTRCLAHPKLMATLISPHQANPTND